MIFDRGFLLIIILYTIKQAMLSLIASYQCTEEKTNTQALIQYLLVNSM